VLVAKISMLSSLTAPMSISKVLKCSIDALWGDGGARFFCHVTSSHCALDVKDFSSFLAEKYFSETRFPRYVQYCGASQAYVKFCNPR
jgi:hypothetical protein